MTRRTIAVLLGALLLTASLAGAGVVLGDTGSTDTQPDSSISVAGSGSAEAEPDKAVLRVTVEATAENASAARDAVATDYEAVKSALLDLGVPEDQIRTVDYDLYRDESRAEKRARETRTTEGSHGGDAGESESVTVVYRASHELAVELDDVDAVGTAIDAAVDGGAEVRGVQFTLDEETREDLREQALQNAMADARSEADTIATSADLDIAGVHSVETADRNVVRRYLERAAVAADSGGTAVSPGPVRVTASVKVTYNATA